MQEDEEDIQEAASSCTKFSKYLRSLFRNRDFVGNVSAPPQDANIKTAIMREKLLRNRHNRHRSA